MKFAVASTRRALAAFGLALVAGAAFAQAGGAAGDWPRRQPIKLVAVFPPGGSVDQVARVLAPVLQQQLGQNVIVENRGGASGAIGTAAVAQAPADGYTLAVVFDTHAVNPSLIPNLPFDTRKDLVPVALVGTSAMVLATHTSTEYKTFTDVVAAARAKKPLNYGTIGNGSLGHLAMSLLGKNGGMEFTHVPYRGGGPLMQDAVAGHVPLAIGSVFLVKPHIDAGRVRPLAVTTPRRAPDLPNVPTIAESGFAGFEAPAWWAVLAPAKTPPEIVRRLNEELNKALKNPEVAKKLDAQGIDVVGGTVESAQRFIDQQVETWARVVRENGIKAD
ncbi:tripartite tricarboxylate transporter substrate binding protein [Ramlibacter sp. MAHUQ-53]|uniref:tripartite tricarboxylate transporter substrate binding protein n=1 Tax=unclassified Ramlibacter TaxID=2617605 RepID=UPI0036459C87